MAKNLLIGIIGLAALSLVVGCADQKTTVTSVNFIQGSANGSTAANPIVIKTWADSAWINPSGKSWTPNGDDGGLNVWINSNGDWSIQHYILNHGIGWHSYETTVVFGHIEGNDPNNFTPFASHVSDTITVHWGGSNTSEASGTADAAIKANFDKINVAKATFHEH